MKKLLIFGLCLIFSFNLFCKEKSENAEINPDTGFPEIVEKPYVMFNEGFCFSQITRVINQKDFNRSNFVWQDYLMGVYCEMQTGNMQPLNSIVRLSAYYPFMHTFNGMEQVSKQVILYGFDFFAGPLVQTDMWKFVRFNFALGPHFAYELSDEYHHFELGGGALLGVELPVSKRFTILVNGLGSFDYGNLGSNMKINPYDFVWQYQIEVGVRYSRRGENKYNYIRK